MYSWQLFALMYVLPHSTEFTLHYLLFNNRVGSNKQFSFMANRMLSRGNRGHRKEAEKGGYFSFPPCFGLLLLVSFSHHATAHSEHIIPWWVYSSISGLVTTLPQSSQEGHCAPQALCYPSSEYTPEALTPPTCPSMSLGQPESHRYVKKHLIQTPCTSGLTPSSL